MVFCLNRFVRLTGIRFDVLVEVLFDYVLNYQIEKGLHLNSRMRYKKFMKL